MGVRWGEARSEDNPGPYGPPAACDARAPGPSFSADAEQAARTDTTAVAMLNMRRTAARRLWSLGAR